MKEFLERSLIRDVFEDNGRIWVNDADCAP